MKRNENFWSYRLHKLGTLTVLRTDRRTDGRTDGQTDGRTDRRTDGRSGPTTRPAFAKATQVKRGNDLKIAYRIKGQNKNTAYFATGVVRLLKTSSYGCFNSCV